MACYAIAQSTITDHAQMERYIADAIPTLEAHGVKILAFDDAPTVIEATVEHARTVLLEFESEQAFRAWYDSAEYRAARELRESASAGSFILVKGTE